MDDETGRSAPEHALRELRAELGEALSTDPAVLAAHSDDRSIATPEGPPLAVVLASSTAQVSRALAWAHRHRVPVSVRGAGSGLAGGAIAYPGGLVLSLAGMDRILELHAADRLAVVQPGVITRDLDLAAAGHGLLFAPDPASSDISTVGGNIATNAGGLRCLAHGPLQGCVAALEVVLADGTVIRTGSRTMKNSTGLNLTPLFVGSEGTLGVITEATVRLEPRPEGTPWTVLACFDALEAAGDAVVRIVGGADRPEVLELIDATCARLIEQESPSGLPRPGAAMLLILTVGPEAQSRARRIAEECERGGAASTAVTEGDAALDARRRSNGALMAGRYSIHCDVGVPVSRLVEMIRGIEQIAAGADRGICVIAHAGDGNLHPAIESDGSPEDRLLAEGTVDRITALALSLGGVITGEHGIGSIKHRELPLQFDADSLRVQHTIKAALDPHGILTPGRGI